MRAVVGVAAIVLTLGGVASVTAATASACPSGTVPSDFSGVCVSGQSSGDEAFQPSPAHVGAAFGGGMNELPTVDGIPCTPQHLGTCIGLAQSAGY